MYWSTQEFLTEFRRLKSAGLSAEAAERRALRYAEAWAALRRANTDPAAKKRRPPPDFTGCQNGHQAEWVVNGGKLDELATLESTSALETVQQTTLLALSARLERN